MQERDSSGDSNENEIPSGRRTLFIAGTILMVAGIVLFVSAFLLVAMNMSHPEQEPDLGKGMMFRMMGGMFTFVVGRLMRTIGARGLAGAGLVLDPEQARKDVRPWTRMGGGIVQDALSEVGVVQKLEKRLDASPEQVKVRCTKCRALNDETAKFCNQCGAAM